ncbi:MAG: hypothetical protein OYH76_06450 [Defluviicoccus sp.]|nr:hypothetical protein [Defluviicoccus sp.]MDE0275517.1 hypothetical protein [Defluviicoccus sp.]
MHFHDWLPVRLIATPRSSLRTCRSDADLAEVLANNVETFDHLPVVRVSEDATETIIGLLDIPGVRAATAPRGAVNGWMHPISENILIGADASILDFVLGADRQRCRLVVSGSEISGLVSLSDLQKLPVRAALFATITHCEITMASAIRREFRDSDAWLDRLSNDRQSKIREEIATSTNDDGFVNSLLFTQFGDKVRIIRKSPRFQWSRTKFKKEMGMVEKLRNWIVHANDYASTPSAAEEVCRTVRARDKWVDRLTQWLTIGIPAPVSSGSASRRGAQRR